MGKYVYPLGSIVLVRNVKKNKEVKVMINSYGIRDKKNNVSYEYAGCEIPVGYNPNEIYFFNNHDIICPIFIGYISEDNKDVRKEVAKHYGDDNITYLPIGSIVEIANKERVMITGLCALDADQDILHDYMAVGCYNKLDYTFNRKDIKEILFVGYQGEEFRKYKVLIDSIYEGLKDKKNVYKELRKLMTKEEEK